MVRLASEADLWYNKHRNIVVLGGATNTPSRIHLIGDVPMDTIPHNVVNSKSYYVYTLAYPENMGGTVFYVGKGQGNRIQKHEFETQNGGTSHKCRIIYEIWVDGGEVVKTKLANFATDKEARMYEAALIFFMDGLTNLSWNAGMPPIKSEGNKRRPVVYIDQDAKKQKQFLKRQHSREGAKRYFELRNLSRARIDR